MSKKDSAFNWIIRGAGFMFIGIFLSKLLNYGYRAIIARWLDPEQYGIFSLGLAVFSVALMITLFGFNFGVERFIGYYSEKKRQNSIFKTAILFTLPLSIIVGVALFFFSDLIALKFFQNIKVSIIIRILAFSLPFFTFSEITQYALKSWKKVKASIFLKKVIEPLAKVIFTILVFNYSFNVFGAALGYALSGITVSVFAFFYIRKKWFDGGSYESKSFKELFYFSWPLLTTGVLYSFITSIDTFMLGYYLEEQFVGVYNVAIITASLLFIPQLIFETLFVPVLSESYRKNKLEEIRSIYKDVSKLIFYLAVPIFAFLIIYGEAFINIFFGAKYITAYWALVILCLGYLFSFSTGPNSSLFNVFGETKIKFFLRIIVFVLNITLNIILIPKYGILGAAFSTGFAVALVNVINVVWYKIKKDINPISSSIFKSGFAVLLAAVITKLVIWSPKSFVFLFISGLIFILLYVLFMYITKTLTKEELLMFYNIFKQKNN